MKQLELPLTNNEPELSTVTVGDFITMSLPKPKWWQFRKMKRWKATAGIATFQCTAVSDTTILEVPKP